MNVLIRKACSVFVLFGLPQIALGQFELGDLAVSDAFSGIGIVNRGSSNFVPLYGGFPSGMLEAPGKLDIRNGGVSFVASQDSIFRFGVVGDSGELVAETEGGIRAIAFDNQSKYLIVCTATNLTWYDVATGEVVGVVAEGLVDPQDIVQLENGDILIADAVAGLLKLDSALNLTVENDEFQFQSQDQITLVNDGLLYVSQTQSLPATGVVLYQMDLSSGETVAVETLQFASVFDLEADLDGNVLFSGMRLDQEIDEGGVYSYDPVNDQVETIVERKQFLPSGLSVVEEPGPLLGDANQDGNVNLLDVAPFVRTIIISQFCVNSDINRDGTVDLLDIEPFVFLLTIQ